MYVLFSIIQLLDHYTGVLLWRSLQDQLQTSAHSSAFSFGSRSTIELMIMTSHQNIQKNLVIWLVFLNMLVKHILSSYLLMILRRSFIGQEFVLHLTPKNVTCVLNSSQMTHHPKFYSQSTRMTYRAVKLCPL